jgi:hypothetical protein
MRRELVAALVAGVAAVAAAPAALAFTNLITNGNFADGLNGWTVTGDSAHLVTSTTAFPNSPLEPYSIPSDGSISTYLLADPNDGDYLHANTFVSQEITGLTIGDTVFVSWDMAYTGPEFIGSDDPDLGNTLFGTINSSSTGIYNATNFSWVGGWGAVFTATQTSYDLIFDIYSPGFADGHGYWGLTNVVAYEVSPFATPEPATWAMMLAGFAGMGAVLRRRRVVTA